MRQQVSYAVVFWQLNGAFAAQETLLAAAKPAKVTTAKMDRMVMFKIDRRPDFDQKLE